MKRSLSNCTRWSGLHTTMPSIMLFNAVSNSRLVLPQRDFALAACDGIGTKYLDRARHGANLIAPFGPRDREIGVASGEPVHQRCQSEHRPGNAAPDQS